MTTVWAADYDIWVGGVRVTDDNKNNINPSGKTAGTITFSGSTLTFNGVKMSCTNTACINIQQEGITVYFKSGNELNSSGKANTIYATEGVVLDGPKSSEGTRATVKITNTASETDGSYAAIFFKNDNAQLSIWNLLLHIESTHFGIIGYNDSNSKCGLYTSCAEIYVTAGDSYAAVSRFNYWTMDDYGMLLSDRQYDASQKRTENADGSVATNIGFVNGLYVGGLPVRATATTPWTVAPSGKTAGTIEYSKKKLSLDGVTYSSVSAFVDNYNVKDLEIESTGTNDITVTASGVPVMRPRADTKLTGSGTLKLTSEGGAAISTFNDCNVTVQMALLEAKGSNYGFWGETNGTLTLKKYADNTLYKFAGGSSGNVYTGNLVMDNMDIWTNNTYFDPTSHYMMINSGIAKASGITNGTWFQSKDRFTYYPIYVAGTQVSNRNSSNILSSYITAGKVSYSATSKTLTLDGVQFEATGDDAPIGIDLRSDMGETTLNFTGDDQHWTTDNDVFAFANSKTTISGDCQRVYLTSNAESGISTRANASVTINTTGFFGVKGAKYGYWGNRGSNEVLTLSKTSADDFGYNFEGTEGAIINVNDLKLDNMDFGYVDSPGNLPGCYFDTEYFRVSQNGGEVAKGGVVSFASIKEKLPIYVAGKQLNRLYLVETAPIYVGSPYITSGPMSVKYTPATKALTLNDATIVEHGNNGTTYTCGIGVTGEGVTINVEGTNNITAGNYGIYSTYDLTIGGTGNLNVTSTELAALALGGFTMTLQFSEGVQTFQGKTYGFCGWYTATLAINKVGNGALYKFAGETADIGAVKNLALGEGVRIHSKYTWFNEDEKAMYRYDDISKNTDIDYGTWIRGDVAWIDYPLYICDTQLYGAYVDGVLKGPASGFCCKQYTGEGIKFDPETQTLTMTDVTIDDVNVSNAVYNEGINWLTIQMEGDNNFKVLDNVFKLDCNTNIEGEGTVKGELDALYGFGIYLSKDMGADVVIEGPTLEFKGQEAIGGHGTNNVTISSPLTFEPNGSPQSAFYNLNSVSFTGGMDITYPVGAYFKPGLDGAGAVTLDGENVYDGKVVIDGSATTYELAVAGVYASNLNKDDILHDGVFSYDPDTKTLTIKGDCTHDDWIVESNIDDLTINVAGASTLTEQTSGASIMRLFGNTTITGGKLTLKGDGSVDNALGIYISDAEYLLIRNAYMEIDGEACEYGITSDGTTALLIDNSDLSISAHNEGCIIDWASISLTNCFIQKPEVSVLKSDGIYGIEDHIMGNSAGPETIVIKAGEMTGIASQESRVESQESRVFDLQGRKVTNPEKGKIYILNGKKVKK